MAYSIAKDAQSVLCEIINQISLTEKKAEQMRTQLCRKTIFNPYASFKKLDSQNNNQIKQEAIIQLLKENDFHVQDISIVFQLQFQREYLNYQDFLTFILPRTDPELREITALKQPTKSTVDPQIDNMIASLFNLEYNEAINLERLKRRLIQYYSADQMFESVDSMNAQYLTFKDFDRFFRRNGLLIYEDELTAFFYRVDQQRLGQINLSDFRRFLEPYQQKSFAKNEEIYTSVKKDYESNKVSQKNSPYIFIDENTTQPKAGQIVQLRSCSTSNKTKSNNFYRAASTAESLQITKFTESSQTEDQKFIDLGLEILKLEMYLEEIRYRLQEQKDFNSLDFFHFMDLKNRGKINQHEFAYFLEQINLKGFNIIDLFTYLDKDEDSLIRYSDISDFIMPTNLNSSQSFSQKKARNSHLSYTISQLFSKTTINLIQQLFTLWRDNEKTIKQKKQQFLKSQNLYQLFSKLDSFKKGTFNKQDLQRFFEQQGIKDDVKLLHKKMMKLNKEINLKEFEQFFIS